MTEYETQLTSPLGECAFFGLEVDENNNITKVRVPCIKSIIQPVTPASVNLDIVSSAISDKKGTLSEIIPAQIPNISGTFSANDDNENVVGTLGAFKRIGDHSGTDAGGHSSNAQLDFDASRCSEVYKNDCKTVQPQTVVMKLFMQIVPTGTQYKSTSNLPIGTIFIYPNINNIPAGAFICDGSVLFEDGSKASSPSDAANRLPNQGFSKEDFDSFNQTVLANETNSVRIFTRNSDYEAEVSTLGFTGAFATGTYVEGTKNLKYIRLPKLSNCFIESTSSKGDIGTSLSAAIPNIAGRVNLVRRRSRRSRLCCWRICLYWYV
jgi:hypothetical protein